MGRLFKRIHSYLLDLFFPRLCLGCRKEGAWVCDACAKNVIAHTSLRERKLVGEVTAITIFDFQLPVVRELLHYLKYNGIYEAAGTLVGLAGRMVPVIAGWLPEDAVLVPVPTSASKMKMRGYNQSEEFAHALGEWLDVPVAADALVRRGKKRSQVGKGREGRAAQVQGAFAVAAKGRERWAGRHLILVDDLITTGSTVKACVQVLREAGCKVSVLALAREG